MKTLALCIGAFAFLVFTSPRPAAQQQVPETIRVEVTVVPIDVIVTDKEGRPVLDLTKDDFVILENGIKQEIAHFAVQRFDEAGEKPVLEPGRTESASSAPAVAGELRSPGHRTFLIVLGRGRHQVFHSVDALADFVREGLTPADRTAVMAYNRATDFTADREQIVRVLERYKKTHEYIEAIMKMRLQGLAAVYGSREIPKSLQPKIDEIFDVPELASRRVIPARSAGMPEQLGRDREAFAQNEKLETERQAPEDLPGQSFDTERASELENLESEMLTDLPFDEYMGERATTDQDLLNLYAAIQYLRFMEGEKHILFFTSQGLFLPNMEDEKSLASIASDARVRIHTLHTGGVDLNVDTGFRSGTTGRREFASTQGAQPVAAGSFSRTFALSSVSEVSKLTGGQAFISRDIGGALNTIDQTTSSVYLLGFRPKDSTLDGKFRQIKVLVLGRDVRVYARRGYYAHPTARPYDQKQLITYARTVNAVNYTEAITDVVFSLVAQEPQLEKEQTVLVSGLRVQFTEEMFSQKEGLYVGDLAVTSFIFDRDGRLVADSWDRLDLKITEPTYKQILKEGLPLSRRFRLPAGFKRGLLKIILYDSANDKVGAQIVKIG